MKEYITDFITKCVFCRCDLDLENCCEETKLSGLCVECLDKEEGNG